MHAHARARAREGDHLSASTRNSSETDSASEYRKCSSAANANGVVSSIGIGVAAQRSVVGQRLGNSMMASVTNAVPLGAS